jgi:hypothetical protein
MNIAIMSQVVGALLLVASMNSFASAEGEKIHAELRKIDFRFSKLLGLPNYINPICSRKMDGETGEYHMLDR